MVGALSACGHESSPPEAAAPPPTAPAPVEPRAAEPPPALPVEAPETEAASADLDADVPELASLAIVGGVELLESANFGSHAHGGSPAELDEARLNLANRDGKPHAISVSRIELLDAHCGKDQGWDRRERLDLRGVDLTIWNEADPVSEGKTGVQVPDVARTYQLTAHVAPFKVYQACDRFGFAMHLDIDGQAHLVELPLRVKRYNPIRR